MEPDALADPCSDMADWAGRVPGEQAMTAREKAARAWHAGSDHAAESPFGGPIVTSHKWHLPTSPSRPAPTSLKSDNCAKHT